MTDLEISKALALAIGWEPNQITVYDDQEYIGLSTTVGNKKMVRIFDYRFWNVSGPIAEKYNCFPYRDFHEKWTTDWTDESTDTPQKAIAMAVIQGVGKWL